MDWYLVVLCLELCLSKTKVSYSLLGCLCLVLFFYICIYNFICCLNHTFNLLVQLIVWISFCYIYWFNYIRCICNLLLLVLTVKFFGVRQFVMLTSHIRLTCRGNKLLNIRPMYIFDGLFHRNLRVISIFFFSDFDEYLPS